MRPIFFSLPLWSFFIAIWSIFPSVASAQQHQVTYDRVVFERSNEGESGDNSWSQLLFTIEGFRIDGLCYHACDIAFSLDGAPSGPYQARADLRVTRELVNRTFPTDFSGQMFIGNRQNTGAERDAIAAFPDREKLALAWIIEHSTALISFAVSSERISSDVLDYWLGQEDVFETRLARAFTTVLSGYRNQIETRNTLEQTRDIVQPALAQLGLYSGSIDGIPGRMTREAVSAFQRERGRLVTGYADGEERAILARILAGETEHDGDTTSHTERLAERLGIELGPEVTEEDVALDAAVELTRLQSEVDRLEAANELSRRLADERLETITDALETIRTLRMELREARGSSDRDPENEVVVELRRQLEAANETIADLRDDRIPRADFERLEERLAAMVPETDLREAERRLVAANETIADLRGSSVPVEEHAELRRQLEAANETIADLREETVPRAEFAELDARLATMVPRADLQEAERRLDAANETLADMRESTVPIEQAAEIARQLEAANATIANLRQTRVPMEDVLVLRRQLDAANQTVADLRADIASNYVDRGDAEMREDTLSRQIRALNQTILELTEDRDRQRTLRLQTEQIYQNWIEDCRSRPACASAMQLD
jgi:peptidoglycan hydrolase-like protein with peptidoglycan-binding domain